MTAALRTEVGDCIRFEIQDGARRVSCAVSGEALDAVSGQSEPSTPALRRRAFDRFRTLINVAAMMRLGAREVGGSGPLLITGRDLERVPPQLGVPNFGTSARKPAAPEPLDIAAAVFS